MLPATASGLLTREPVHEALRRRGYAEKSECVNIEGVPVQFLPVDNALVEEALSEAVETASGARSRPASGAPRGDNVANGPRQGPTAILHLSC